MYKCNDCETIFENPKKIPAEIYYGVDREFNYRCGDYVETCPTCESNYIEKNDNL